MSRTDHRKAYEIDVRLSLLEDDADEFEALTKEIVSAFRKLIMALVGITITLGTSTVMLALNLIVR